MRAGFLALSIILPLATAGAAEPSPLAQAVAEERAAEAEVARLEQAAGAARGEASALAARQRVAAAQVEAAEAGLSVAQEQLRDRRAAVAASQAALAREQAPAAALVAGLVRFGRRPPIVTMLDRGSLGDVVHARLLLDSTLPVIRRRSATLAARLHANRQLAAEASRAATTLAEARQALAVRQQRFAALERQANQRAARLDAGAIGAGDQLLAAGEGLDRTRLAAAREREARRSAMELAALPAAAPRPFPANGQPSSLPFPYALPVAAPVTAGLGTVSDSGIRARGVTLAARPGQPVAMPADGTIVFAGPFRRFDGVVIIDHGGGWMTMLVGVASAHPRGTRLPRGVALGRALGPVEVDLSTSGRPVSAALAALPG